VIKPAYSFSFLLSINIFLRQNVLYFLETPRNLDLNNQNGYVLFSYLANVIQRDKQKVEIRMINHLGISRVKGKAIPVQA